MKPPYYVETLTRQRDVKTRQALTTLPIRIGRGYDNDVILNDPYVASNHAVIEEAADGGLRIRDLGSRNGMIVKGVSVGEAPLDAETEVRLGHTQFRVRGVDYAVDAEQVDQHSREWEGWLTASAGLFFILGFTLFNTWLSDTESFEAFRYVGYMALGIALSVIWCGIWAFAGRLFSGGARFARHLLITGCGLLAIELWYLFSSAAAFGLSWEFLTRYGGHMMIAIAAVTIFFHLKTVNPRRASLVAFACVALAIVASGLLLASNYYRHERLASEFYMSSLYPPAFRLSANQPVDRLIGDAKKLKVTLDAKRTDMPDGDDDFCCGDDW